MVDVSNYLFKDNGEAEYNGKVRFTFQDKILKNIQMDENDEGTYFTCYWDEFPDLDYRIEIILQTYEQLKEEYRRTKKYELKPHINDLLPQLTDQVLVIFLLEYFLDHFLKRFDGQGNEQRLFE